MSGRAKIILATADGCGTTEIMRRSGKSKPVVWTWQARFMAEGVAGLLRDKTQAWQGAAPTQRGEAGCRSGADAATESPIFIRRHPANNRARASVQGVVRSE